METVTITITINGDGTYTVTEQEDEATPGDQPVNATVSSLEDVLGLVQRALGDDSGQAAWDAEAAKRIDEDQT